MKCSLIALTKNTAKHPGMPPRVLLVIYLGWLTIQQAAAVLSTVQPFADDVCNDTRRDGDEE